MKIENNVFCFSPYSTLSPFFQSSQLCYVVDSSTSILNFAGLIQLNYDFLNGDLEDCSVRRYINNYKQLEDFVLWKLVQFTFSYPQAQVYSAKFNPLNPIVFH